MEMDAVTGHPDQPLHQNQIARMAVLIGLRLGRRADEYHDVAAPGLARMKEWHPLCRLCQGDPVHHQVIAHQHMFSIEPDGITKFRAKNVRMNRPTTSTERMLATASNGVSFLFASPPPA